MFRLALALGRTVRELEASLTASELVEWVVFARLEPWWPRQTHRAIATLAAVTFAANGAGRGVRAEQLMPWIDDPPVVLGADIPLTDAEHTAAIDRLLGLS